MKYLCTECWGGLIPTARAKHQIKNNLKLTCPDCGERLAQEKAKSYCIAPMHKSNYMLITDLADLKGLNNKGGLIK